MSNDIKQKARELASAVMSGAAEFSGLTRDDIERAIAQALTAARAEGRAEAFAEAKQACLDIAAPMYPHAAQPVLMCAASIAALAKAGERGGGT